MSRKTLGAGMLTVAIMLTGVLGAGSGAASSQASKAVTFTNCDISGKETRLGASYVTSVKVSGVTCTKGKNLVRAYHACRKDKGGGVCGSPGLGFSCKEGKRQTVPDVQYSSTMK